MKIVKKRQHEQTTEDAGLKNICELHKYILYSF